MASKLRGALIAASFCAVFVAPSFAQAPTAAELFEETLNQEGLEAAATALQAALADTSEAFAVDPYELAIGLPSRLVNQGERIAARRLLELLEPKYGDDPRYWWEMAKAHIVCAERKGAREALLKARESGGRPDLPWTLENLDALIAAAALKISIEDDPDPGEFLDRRGPYLGEKPPGTKPKIFAPGTLSGSGHEYHISFAPDGNEIYFSRGGVGTLVTRRTDQGWTRAEPSYLMGEEILTEEANLTPDGRAIVFCGRKDLRSNRVLYRAERTASGWGTPLELFEGMYATSALDGTLYYTEQSEPPDYGKIVYREWNGRDYGEPMLVEGESINSPAPDAHPFIAPDGQTLLFDSYRDPGAGIYASFRRPDGSWSTAVCLSEELGIPPVGQCALSPDGKYLFFSLAGDMYWVEAAFLWNIRDDLGSNSAG